MQPGINHFVFIGVILLGLGIYTAAVNKNILKILIGISMIYLASIINFAGFSNFREFNPEGQVILFIISVASFLIFAAGLILKHNYGKSILNEGEQDD